eukprot:TRINITY_DN5542_c0_g1_i3.p1 TRINITY_DN5542_c0_g1~~TRINITY_DN5542_c0_g1_i3.p1  ORF type:complete len:195 (+),score=29.25 TRINITY_DN5542_c0_g1_i3:71-655(+)
MSTSTNTPTQEENHEFDPKCIFCNIVAKKSPCYEVYSDDDVICFLDIYPLHPGHTLVIPKKHYKDLSLMPGELAASCMKVVPRVARSLMAATKTKDFNVMLNSGKLAGQEVFHAHFHIIPRSKGDSLSKSWCSWSTQPLKSELAKNMVVAIKEDLEINASNVISNPDSTSNSASNSAVSTPRGVETATNSEQQS